MLNDRATLCLNRCWCALALTVSMTGCSVLTDSSLTASLSRAASAESEDAAESQIANPPARTIRFDGHEIVLGDAEAEPVDSEKFVAMLQPLVEQKRFRSARWLVQHRREASQRLLSERWASGFEDPVIQLVADELSLRDGREDSNWNSLLKLAKDKPKVAKPYQELRNTFAAELQTADPSNDKAAQLQQLAQEVNHPLVKIDSLRLLGLRELVAQRTGWAESLCRQAIEVATKSGNPTVAAELWLMVAEAARRSDQATISAQAWSSGVTLHLSSTKADAPIDVAFWLMAEHTRPKDKPWPSELTSHLASHVKTVGCSAECEPEVAFWTSIGGAQFQRNEMQAALLNFKRAETLVSGSDAMWLRIAQSKCLAAMGQTPAASAILSGPAASSEPAIAAAAAAAMGSLKLQAGAYQQGAQLLNKAVTQASSVQWATKNEALADLALAQLIIGDTEPGLEALHAAQAELEHTGDELLLIRSLENELRLLQHEQRDKEAAKVQQRISELEDQPVAS